MYSQKTYFKENFSFINIFRGAWSWHWYLLFTELISQFLDFSIIFRIKEKKLLKIFHPPFYFKIPGSCFPLALSSGVLQPHSFVSITHFFINRTDCLHACGSFVALHFLQSHVGVKLASQSGLMTSSIPLPSWREMCSLVVFSTSLKPKSTCAVTRTWTCTLSWRWRQLSGH